MLNELCILALCGGINDADTVILRKRTLLVCSTCPNGLFLSFFELCPSLKGNSSTDQGAYEICPTRLT